MAAAAAAKEQGGVNKEGEKLFVYRISTAEEWEALQRNGSTFGGELDKTTGCFHLSNLHQVQSTLQNFFLDINRDLYLLQIDAEKISPQRETNEAQQGPSCRCYERACPVCFKRRSRHRGLLKRLAKTSAAFGI